jgi:multisubunit Na+/H+ antiporter MnhB subunit
MSEGKAETLRRISNAALVLIVALIFVGLVSAVVALPPSATGLSNEVDAELARSGMHNPVTMTLLDLRSFDTLLEIAVLLAAVTAIRTLRRGGLPAMRPRDEILVFLSRVLVPVMILIAGYLFMAGLDASGGAFQAGAILAAAGVLLILAGRSPPLRDDGMPIRFGLVVGLAAFVAVGVAGLLTANVFLDYPESLANEVALLLEIGVSVSVALSLLQMFVGVLHRGNAEGTTRVVNREEQ